MADKQKPGIETKQVAEGFTSVHVRDGKGGHVAHATILPSLTVYGPFTPDCDENLDVLRGRLLVITEGPAGDVIKLDACREEGDDNKTTLKKGQTVYLFARTLVLYECEFLNEEVAKDETAAPKPPVPGPGQRQQLTPMGSGSGTGAAGEGSGLF